jgi:hypothetical protein
MLMLKPKKNGREQPVMIATPDQDAGLVPADRAEVEAQRLADETNQPVTVREHISDKVIASLKPKAKKAKAERSVDTPLSNIASTPQDPKKASRRVLP